MPKRKKSCLRVRISECYKKAIECIRQPLGTKKYRRAKTFYDRARRTAYELLPIIRRRFGKKKKRCVLGLTSLFHKIAWTMALRLENRLEVYI